MTKADQPDTTASPSRGPDTRMWRDFARPLAVLAGLGVIAATACIHFAVAALNAQSTEREMQLVHNGLALQVEEVAKLVVPQADWDDAVRNLDNRFDYAWAHANINEFLNHAYGFDAEFVLDGMDRTLYAAVDGEDAPIGAYEAVRPRVARLVGQVRQMEAMRGVLSRRGKDELVSQAIQASALKTIDGELTIMTATLVQPDFGTALPAGARAPIVVTAMRIDRPFLAQFSRRFLLDDVTVRLPSRPATAGKSAIATRDETGRVQAYLEWTPLNPGYGILHRMVTPFLLVMLVAMAIAAVELRRMFRLGLELIERERFAHKLAFQDPLTGLPNRHSFDEQLEWQLASIQPGAMTVSVTCIRLLGLHELAERSGVAARDELICQVADRLVKICRADTILARVATNEFAVLSVTATGEEASRIVERVRRMLFLPIQAAGQRMNLHFAFATSKTDAPMAPSQLFHDAWAAAVRPDTAQDGRHRSNGMPAASPPPRVVGGTG